MPINQKSRRNDRQNLKYIWYLNAIVNYTCHILTLVTAVLNNLFNINQDAATKIKNHTINTTLTAVAYITIS